MSESFNPSNAAHLENPTSEWKNINDKRVEDFNKAHEMALTEDGFRTLIKKQGRAALEAANKGNYDDYIAEQRVMESNLKTGPLAVEQTGWEYDRARKEEIDEQNSLRPEWNNVTDERIEDPVKAAHMAPVEDAWRTKVHETAQHAKSLTESDNPLAPLAVQSINEANRYEATVNGPRAVEATGQAYDELHNPELPKSA